MANARAQDRDRDAGGRQPGFCQPVARGEAQRTARPGRGGRKFSDNRRGDLERRRKIAAGRLSRQHVDRSFFRARRGRQGAALSSDQGFRLHHTDLRLSDGGCDRSEFAARVLWRSHRPRQGRAVRRDLRDEPARQRAPSDRRIDQRRSRHFAARHSLPG